MDMKLAKALENDVATDKLLYLDYKTATPEYIISLVKQGGNLTVRTSYMGDDNEIHLEGPLDKAILARNLPVARCLIALNVKHNFERWKMHLGELSFLIENDLEKEKYPLVEYSKIARNDRDFDKTYLPLLHKYRSVLNKHDDKGMTPLMYLISSCYYEHRKPLIRTLVAIIQEFDVDYTATDSEGHNLLYYVKDSNLDKGWFNDLGKWLVKTIEERTEKALEKKRKIATHPYGQTVSRNDRQRAEN